MSEDCDLSGKEGTEIVYQTPAQRQEERMAGVPALYKTTHERLAVELALRMEEPGEIFARYHYTPEAAAELMESDAFSILLSRIGKEIAENGLSFRTKVRAIAEDLLPFVHQMATDPLCSSAVRADIIKWATKVAGLEPKEKEELAGRGGFVLNITFAGEAPQKIVSHEPVTITQE